MVRHRGVGYVSFSFEESYRVFGDVEVRGSGGDGKDDDERERECDEVGAPHGATRGTTRNLCGRRYGTATDEEDVPL